MTAIAAKARERLPIPEPQNPLWPLICDPAAALDSASLPELRRAAGRLVRHISPGLAQYLLRRHDGRVDPPLIDPVAIQRARQLSRLERSAALSWAARIAEARIGVVYLKGFASSHLLYPDPSIRGMSDIDLLVHGRDLHRLVEFLTEAQFAFRRTRMPRWGLISDASYMPLVSSDGITYLDIHTHPDDYPVHRAISTDAVFDRSRTRTIDGIDLRFPSPTHHFFLAITNRVRDKFDATSLNGLADAIVALQSDAERPDWAAIENLARSCFMTKGLRATVTLLARLGIPRATLPEHLIAAYRGWTARAFEKMVADHFRLDSDRIAPATEVLREWLLCAEGPVLLWKNWRRLRGLARPWPGIPAFSRP